MANILISPGKYVQGAGEMKKLGTYAASYGKKALILISAGGYKRIGKEIEDSFSGVDCEAVFDYFNGECSKKEIDRLCGIMKENGCDLVIGWAAERFSIPPKQWLIIRRPGGHLPHHRFHRRALQCSFRHLHRRRCFR